MRNTTIKTAEEIKVDDSIFRVTNNGILLAHKVINIEEIESGKWIEFTLDNGVAYLLSANHMVLVFA